MLRQQKAENVDSFPSPQKQTSKRQKFGLFWVAPRGKYVSGWAHEQPPANPEDLSNVNSNTSEFAGGRKIHQGGGQNRLEVGGKRQKGQDNLELASLA